MSEFEVWLKQATRHLSKESAAQVGAEIREHYQSAREAATDDGATTDEAERLALRALGDASAVNCQYRKALLTSDEARMMRNAAWEARTVCSSPWLKWLFLAISVAALLAAAICFFVGAGTIARVLLPVNTPSRGRVFRGVRWVVLIGILALTLGPDLKSFWLLTSCLSMLAWIEWTRVSIRRKLPVAQWPRHLYL